MNGESIAERRRLPYYSGVRLALFTITMGFAIGPPMGFAGAVAAETPAPVRAKAPVAVPSKEKLDFKRCLQLARENFPLVSDAELQVRVQQAQSDQAFWAFWTPIEVVGMIGGPTPEAYGTSRYLRSEASLQGDLNFGKPGFFAGYSVRGAIPLFTFGKLSNLRRAADAGVTIAGDNKKRVQNEAMANLARAYFGHIAAASFVGLVDDSQKTLNEAIETTQKLLKKNSDQVTESDLFMLRSLLGQLLARRAEAVQGLNTTKELVRFLIHRPEDLDFDLVMSDLEMPATPPPPAAVFEGYARDHRPESRMANQAVEARKSVVSIRQASLLPDFVLFGYFTQNYTSNQDFQRNPFLNNTANELSGGVALGARITLDFPTKLAQIREAKAELDKAENQAQLLTSAVTLQVRKAYEAMAGASAQAAEYQKSEKAAKSWLVSSALNFESGLGPANELFQAVRTYGEAGGLRRKAMLDFNMARADMAEALGAEWPVVIDLWTGAK